MSRHRQVQRCKLKKKWRSQNAKALRYLTNPPAPAWRAAHADYSQMRNPILRPVVSRRVRVWNEFWTAFSVWKKIYGVWSCISADPVIRWMVGKTPSQVHLELLKLGAEFEWEGSVSPCVPGSHPIPEQNQAPVRQEHHQPARDALARPATLGL